MSGGIVPFESVRIPRDLTRRIRRQTLPAPSSGLVLGQPRTTFKFRYDNCLRFTVAPPTPAALDKRDSTPVHRERTNLRRHGDERMPRGKLDNGFQPPNLRDSDLPVTETLGYSPFIGSTPFHFPLFSTTEFGEHCSVSIFITRRWAFFLVRWEKKCVFSKIYILFLFMIFHYLRNYLSALLL